MKLTALAVAAIAASASAAPLRIITLIPIDTVDAAAPAHALVPEAGADFAQLWAHTSSVEAEHDETQYAHSRDPCGRHHTRPAPPTWPFGAPLAGARSHWPSSLRELFRRLGMRVSGRHPQYYHHEQQEKHAHPAPGAQDEPADGDSWHARVEALMDEAAARADAVRLPSVAVRLPGEGERQRAAWWKALEGKGGVRAHHHLAAGQHEHEHQHQHAHLHSSDEHVHHQHGPHGHHGHHRHAHGQRRPAVSFRARIHRAIWTLRPAEALAIAFVVGAGLGSIVHFFFMLLLLGMRRMVCGSKEARRARRAARREERRQRKAQRWARKSDEGKIRLVGEDELPEYVEKVDVAGQA